MEDKLFDVDLESMTLFPCFWKGVALKVVRATWFYSSLTDSSYIPISWDDALSRDLDNAYSQAQRWLHSTEDNENDGPEVEEETDKSNLYALPSMKDKGCVSFQDAEVGRIFSQDLRGRFLSVVGGSIVVRGFDRAEKIAEKKSFSPLFNISLPWAGDDEKDGASRSKGLSRYTEAQRKGSSAGAQSASKREGAAQTASKPPSGGGADGSNQADPSTNGDKDERRSFAAKLIPSSDAALRPLVTLKKLFGYDENEAADEEKWKDEPPELVFAIHGMGQQLTEDFEALDFIYDVEHLRNLASENSSDPAIRRLSRGRRAQFLPICWRRHMEFDDRPEGNDNFYTLDDITNSAAIPLVRNVITKVVLDVPFYLTSSPEDDRFSQPSKVAPLAQHADRDLRRNDCLHFNTKNLFLIGSPLAFFFHLDGGQLIARSGTDRHPDCEVDSDAVHPESGRYGCLAAENVYNCFNPNDPVAFQLAPTVDSGYAKLVKPISIENATEALLHSLALPRISVSRIFEKYKDHPFQGVCKIIRQAKILENDRGALPADLSRDEKEQVKDREIGQRVVEDSDYIDTVRKWQHLQEESSHSSQAPSPKARQIQTESGARKKLLQPEAAIHAAALSEESVEEGFDLDSFERGERRFRALNPHGCIDYHLSASISLSGYLDMFGAHLAYWTHRDFAVFALTQLSMDFTKKDELTLVPELQAVQRGDSDGDEAEGEEEEDDDDAEDDDDGDDDAE
ncbi:related to phosphatidic acid-preferring phospholipase A1 [Ustilago bromivora]|uniref:Related to phosphatidic acid-preferring phospholipase A1 n=1 Tax=Ustilago bromivora TaxID=307758 RepID=A0A1K0GTM5_9BASI|nr:related to phosphatidic acid-preferring phospholipase A1 [Ustilago bromivora]